MTREVEEYRGFTIFHRSGFIHDKFVARDGDGTVHSRRFLKTKETAVALYNLKQDIDHYVFNE